MICYSKIKFCFLSRENIAWLSIVAYSSSHITPGERHFEQILLVHDYKYLQMSILEYKEFDVHTTGKHVYVKAAKYLNKVYWQPRWNKTAIKICREQSIMNKLESVPKRKEMI